MKNGSIDEHKGYLNYQIDDDMYFLDDKYECLCAITVFTESELEDIDETGFIREEVME